MIQRRIRITSVVAIVFLAALLLTPVAEAARHRRSNPAANLFVTTPFGVIPKSQFYGFMMNPQQLQAQRAAEQKYLDSINKKKTAAKPAASKSTTKKK